MRPRQVLATLANPILLRIAPWLFVTVALVQLCALYPLIQTYREQLYERRAEFVRYGVEGVLAHSGLGPPALNRALDNVMHGPVRGLAIHDAQGRVLLRRGEVGSGPPSTEAAGLRKRDAGTLELWWSTEGQRVLVTVDVGSEAAAVEDFALKAALLSLPSALLATLAAAILVLVGVIWPIQRLRDELLARAGPDQVPQANDDDLDELEQLRLLVQRLEEARAAARAAELRAEAANAAKDEFLAHMSHELNTPLGSVISFAELLLESPAGTDPQVRRDLQRIIGSAGHVTDLVRDILTFSKLGGGRLELELERCPLDELVSDAVAVVEPAMHQSGNRFTVDLPTEAVELYTDRVKVRQCLINVLGNAAKFTSHGQVSLTVQLQDQAVVFSVRDTGIGMSDSEIGRVFEPFVQADGSTTRRFGGTGLGLSITRGLCQLLGGSVTATSTLGAGSTFVLSVPRVSAPTAQQSSGATA